MSAGNTGSLRDSQASRMSGRKKHVTPTVSQSVESSYEEIGQRYIPGRRMSLNNCSHASSLYDPSSSSRRGSSTLPQQPGSAGRSSARQLPTFIPLPVFRFTGPSSPCALRSGSLGNIAHSLPQNTARRNTLTAIFFPSSSSPSTPSEKKQLCKENSSGSELTGSEGSDERRKSDAESCEKPLIKPSPARKQTSFDQAPQPQQQQQEQQKQQQQQQQTQPDVKFHLARRRQVCREESRDDPDTWDTMSKDGYKSSRVRSIKSNYSFASKKSVDVRNCSLNIPKMMDDGGLNSHELDFLHFSANGDIEGLEKLFEEQTYYLFYLNVNCVDSLDRTALSLATINNHVDVVKFLLDQVEGIKLGDALFYAIQCEFVETIELLLEKDPQTSIQVVPGTTSPFEPGLTPFMMAAHKNNYKILCLLYRYSHRLTFSENEFILDEGFDPYSWDAVMERLLHYRARASPSFMLLMFNEKGMSWDPLIAAMDLFNELHQLGQREREVEEAYLKMSQQCETFAIQLLEEVRSASELADLMQYDLDDDIEDVSVLDDETESIAPERRQKIRHYLKPIEKAVKYEMKDFVTSDNSQLALIYIQKGKLFRRLKGIKATVIQILLGFLFPILSLALLMAPKSAMGKVMQNPTVKFWCWVISEVVFIAMLLTNTIMMQYDFFKGADGGISPLLTVAYLWVVGKFIQESREIYHQGLREYMTDIWNWNDMTTIILYTAYMVLRLIHIATAEKMPEDSKVFWHGGMFDPLPLSDICIAISYILIHMRIMELLRAERTFGPLQVSLDLMLHDAFRFSVIFCIVFLAFGSGITELYTPYAFDKNCSCNSPKECNVTLDLLPAYTPEWNEMKPSERPCVSCKDEKPSSLKLTNIFEALSSMFWTLFGYWDAAKSIGFPNCPEKMTFTIWVVNTPKSQAMTTFEGALSGMFWTLFGYGSPQQWYAIDNCPEKNALDEVAGGIIIGLYHFGAIILLVNMLIAMMSNSFQKTHDDSEREWKFHRTQLWLKFIRNEINCPPPMNLLPTWKSICKLLSKIVSWFRRMSGRVYRINNPSSQDLVAANGENHIHLRRRTGIDPSLVAGASGTLFDGESRYTKVLRLVVLRYVKKKVLHAEMVI